MRATASYKKTTRLLPALFDRDGANVPPVMPVTPVIDEATLADSEAWDQRVRACNRMRSCPSLSKSLKFVVARFYAL